MVNPTTPTPMRTHPTQPNQNQAQPSTTNQPTDRPTNQPTQATKQPNLANQANQHHPATSPSHPTYLAASLPSYRNHMCFMHTYAQRVCMCVCVFAIETLKASFASEEPGSEHAEIAALNVTCTRMRASMAARRESCSTMALTIVLRRETKPATQPGCERTTVTIDGSGCTRLPTEPSLVDSASKSGSQARCLLQADRGLPHPLSSQPPNLQAKTAVSCAQQTWHRRP